jgi:uncharacterized DUF497 family protein
MTLEDRLSRVTGFEWDAGNLAKNWQAHQVSSAECEQVFFDQPLIVALDALHSGSEERLFALGRTGLGRLLFVVFTFRGDLIRVISARDMSRKERKAYEENG